MRETARVTILLYSTHLKIPAFLKCIMQFLIYFYATLARCLFGAFLTIQYIYDVYSFMNLKEQTK